MKYTAIFGILGILLVFSFSNQVFAEKLDISQECIDGIMSISTSFDGQPISGVSIYFYNDVAMREYEGKVVTNDNGVAEIEHTPSTNFAKITKGGFNDTTIQLQCDYGFREQSMKIFLQSSTNIGIIEDDETGLPVVDLGNVFGIAGTGTMPDYIEVLKNGNQFGIISSSSISPASSHGEWQISQTYFSEYQNAGKYSLNLFTNNEKTHVFEFIVKQINLSNPPPSSNPDENNSDFIVPEPTVTLITWEETRMPNHWLTTVRFCPGPVGVTEPTIIFDTDVEQILHVWSKKISAGSCAQDFFEVKANDPSSIRVKIGNFKQSNDDVAISALQSELESLRNEISTLRDQIEKKDAVIMEQLKVIQQLATNFKKTLFDSFKPFFNYS